MTKNARMLIVGGIPVHQNMLQVYCNRKDVESVILDSAEECLEYRDLDSVVCIVSDFYLPGMGGIELQRRLCEQGWRIPIVFLSQRSSISLVVQAMQRKAVSVLDGTEQEDVFLNVLDHALEVSKKLRKQQQLYQDIRQKLQRLTEKEKAVLRLVLAGQKNTLIAKQLGIGLRTVESYRHNVHKKTETDSLPALVKMVVQSEREECFC